MERTDLTIIHAQGGHVPILTSLFNSYRIFYGQPPDLDAAREFVAERISKRESVIFLALDDRQGLGFVQLYPSFSSVAMQRIWIVNDLFVSPPARGQGVAEALLRRAEQLARETHARRLELSTATDNLAAQQLYEKLGWQRETKFFHYHLDCEA